MRKTVWILLLATLFPALSRAAEPADLCRTDLHRLLRVSASRLFIARSIRLPPPPTDRAEDYIIAVSGSVVGQRVDDELCDECSTKQTVIAGPRPAQPFATLRQALGDNHVGIQESCFFANELSGPTGVRIIGTYELTWYGKAGRRNTFQVLHDDPGKGGALLPPCTEEVVAIMDAVVTYVGTVAARPGGGACMN